MIVPENISVSSIKWDSGGESSIETNVTQPNL